MNIKYWTMASALIMMSSFSVHAQTRKHLEIEEVLHLAFSQSNQAKALDANVHTKQLQYEASKDSYLPETKLSGTYLAMNTPNIDFKINTSSSNGNEGGGMPDISPNQLMLGQLSINMPLYTGGKIKNNIKSAEDTWKAAELNSMASKQNLSVQALHLYLSLYKAQQTTALIAENIKKSEQQVKDFTAMEENGLIARNDLLKAELQLSDYKVSYQEAAKNVKVLNFRLNTLLGLDTDSELDEIKLAKELSYSNIIDGNLKDRYEIKALEAQKEVAEDQIKVAKAAYKPTFFVTAGYAAINVPSVVTVTNALNAGVGLSYDLGSFYKNKKNINVAKQTLAEVERNREITVDNIKNQIQEAQQEVLLAQEKNKLHQQALDQSNENYRIVKDKYENGVADTDDLLTADVQQLQCKINLAMGKADLVETYYNLLLAHGQLNIQ